MTKLNWKKDLPGVVDAHMHNQLDKPGVIAWMRKHNVQCFNINWRGTNRERMEAMEKTTGALHKKYPETFHHFTTFDFNGRNEPGWLDGVKSWLDTAFENGARGVKIWKSMGMKLRDPDNSWVMADDPAYEKVYDHIEGLGKIIIAHLADPIGGWQPLGPKNVSNDYFSKAKDWYMYNQEGAPSHADIMASMDRVTERHPGIRMVGAHMASMSHDLDALGARMDRFPNMTVDTSGRIKQIDLLPAGKVREFFTKFADRIMFATDYGFRAETDEADIARMDELIAQSYEILAAKVELPAEVLEKVFWSNAQGLLKI